MCSARPTATRCVPGAAYEMPSATWEAAKRMHQALGIARGIVVQTTTYGADHRVVLDGLAALGPGYKGCANALVFESASDAELERLHRGRVRGARFSFRQALGAVLSRAAFDRAVGKLRELGWYMKIQPEQNGIVESVSWFERPRAADPDRPHGPARRFARARARPEHRQAARAAAARQLLGDALARRKDLAVGTAVGRRRAAGARAHRCRARALRVGFGLAAPGLEEAAAQRRRPLELLYRYVRRRRSSCGAILVDNPASCSASAHSRCTNRHPSPKKPQLQEPSTRVRRPRAAIPLKRHDIYFAGGYAFSAGNLERIDRHRTISV